MNNNLFSGCNNQRISFARRRAGIQIYLEEGNVYYLVLDL